MRSNPSFAHRLADVYLSQPHEWPLTRIVDLGSVAVDTGSLLLIDPTHVVLKTPVIPVPTSGGATALINSNGVTLGVLVTTGADGSYTVWGHQEQNQQTDSAHGPDYRTNELTIRFAHSGYDHPLHPVANLEPVAQASLEAMLALPGLGGWSDIAPELEGTYRQGNVYVRFTGSLEPFIGVSYVSLLKAGHRASMQRVRLANAARPTQEVLSDQEALQYLKAATEPGPWLSAGDLVMRYDGGNYVEFRAKSDYDDMMFLSRDALSNALSLMPVRHVLAKYKSKKKIKNKDGEETTVYMYSEKQIANRHRQKAKRIEALRGKMGDLRKKVKRDLKSSDPEKMLTALAVALMDHTYERVGNSESADDGHFGVTGWQKKHVTFGKGTATLNYVGKSGVKQKKKVDDASIVKALRDAYEAAGSDDDDIFAMEAGGKITAEKVNAYLKEFDISAKDIRGLHANEEMREALAQARKEGGKLPADKKAKEKKLKAEFMKALEATAEAVGHEPATLRNQYLVPALEDTYMTDGSVISKLDD